MNSLKSINNTYLFRLYDKSIKLNETIVKLMHESEILGDEELSDYIKTIDKRYMFPLKNQTINDYKAGSMKLIYNNKNYKLPNTIPCFLVNNGKGINCVVNLSNYISINKKNNYYNIDTKILYGLMESGTILSTCYSKYKIMKNKTKMISLGSYIYATLFTRVMNRLFTLSITPAKTDIIMFLSGLFFLNNLLGRDEESSFDLNSRYAMSNCKSSSQLLLEDSIREFDFQKDFSDLDTFIQALARNIAGLEDLTTKVFTEQYISTYGPNMMMGLEFLPTFIHNLGYVQIGCFLNNQNVMENCVGKEIKEFMSEFSTL